MPLYRITAPNGQTYQIEGPPGASDADVARAVLAQNPEAGSAPAAPKESTIGSELVRGGSKLYLPPVRVLKACLIKTKQPPKVLPVVKLLGKKLAKVRRLKHCKKLMKKTGCWARPKNFHPKCLEV